ncbi:hypothetical protein CGZ98_06145 [Enemella evansiae]|nr:hypothetical protein CGZ98_06145 [Enemella evansiae]
MLVLIQHSRAALDIGYTLAEIARGHGREHYFVNEDNYHWEGDQPVVDAELFNGRPFDPEGVRLEDLTQFADQTGVSATITHDPDQAHWRLSAICPATVADQVAESVRTTSHFDAAGNRLPNPNQVEVVAGEVSSQGLDELPSHDLATLADYWVEAQRELDRAREGWYATSDDRYADHLDELDRVKCHLDQLISSRGGRMTRDAVYAPDGAPIRQAPAMPAQPALGFSDHVAEFIITATAHDAARERWHTHREGAASIEMEQLDAHLSDVRYAIAHAGGRITGDAIHDPEGKIVLALDDGHIPRALRSAVTHGPAGTPATAPGPTQPVALAGLTATAEQLPPLGSRPRTEPVLSAASPTAVAHTRRRLR